MNTFRPLALSLIVSSPLLFAEEGPGLWDLKGVWQAAFNEDGSRVIVQMRDGGLGIWDSGTGAPVAGELGTLVAKGVYEIDPTHGRALVGFEGGGSRVFDLADGRAVSPPIEVGFEAGNACFSADGSQVVVFDKAGACQVVDVAAGKVVAKLGVTAACQETELFPRGGFSRDGKLAFILGAGGVLHRYDTATWTKTGAPMAHPNPEAYSCGFALSDDALHAVTFDSPGENGPNGSLQLWDTKTCQPVGGSISEKNGVSASFLKGGKRLLILPGRGATRVVRIPSLATEFAMPRHDDVEASRAQATVDGEHFLSWGYDSSVRRTDSASGKAVGIFSNRASVQAVLMGPDSQSAWLALDNTAFFLERQYDSYVIRLDLATMRPVALVRFSGFLHRQILSPGANLLMIHEETTDKERIRLFDAKTLKELAAIK